MRKRKVSNPLALAVLALLTEKPMHPYEMSSTLRERAKEESIKLNYGSLYSVVESLRRHELIEVQETVREGRRPERTVYAITDAGRDEFVDWESELLSVPVKEYTRFEAALSLVPSLPPDEVVRLLETRRVRLSTEVVSLAAVMEEMTKQGMPYLFAIEADYVKVLREAELRFVEQTIERIENGTLEGVDVWRHAHEQGDMPVEADWERAVAHLRSVK
ncbi:PadR family transcriptional regulator [Actinophytocola gossypii]|uniref:PadR family transcriptional regulator n=1 Tax=Actinophytocola gossypii TaxID=2812003 RepID=A0ABT2JGG3_9PSEU|nr:PadR family transcriptional regulator [Actinophytocola gossypii]MCT2586967.1 PadR family transcriptional regulator [Actinophytocola gossypii]